MKLEQARKNVEKEYPGQEIGLGFAYKDAWYFRVGTGENGGIHAVDDKTGVVTGNLPLLALLGDAEFASALQKAAGPVKKNFEMPDDSVLEHFDYKSWREGDFLTRNGIAGQKWDPSEEHYEHKPPDFLSHHGIIGMHWYVRRFQDKNGRLTPEGKIRYAKENGKKETSGHSEEKKNGFATEAAIATAYVSAIVATSAVAITKKAIAAHNEKMGDTLLDKKGIADTSKTFSNDAPPKKIVGEHTAEDDMAKVNEAYGPYRPQTLNNCSHCSITMELRRRGFDVCSRTSSEPVYTREQLKKAFKPEPKNEEIVWSKKPKNYDKMSLDERKAVVKEYWKNGDIAKSFRDVAKNMVKALPEGSRGLFSAVNPFAGVGHAMAFEVKGGKVVIYDCQSNMKFNLSSPPKGFSAYFSAASSMCYRLDNKKINWDGLNDICAERTRV